MDPKETNVNKFSQIKKSRYMPGLDGIRAIAVCAVMAYHFGFKWAPGGFLGVGVFFVLSGYLITDILVRQWGNTGQIDLRDFWLRRARRLLPGLFLLLIVVAVWMGLFHFSRFANLWGDWLASFFYVTNWWFIFSDVGYFSHFGQSSPLLHLWSLAVEEQFYLFWPFLLLLGLRFIPKCKWLICAIVLVALISVLDMAFLHQPGLMDTSRVYYGTDTRAFSLLIGAVLALCLSSEKLTGKVTNNKRLRITFDTVGIAGLVILFWMFWQTNQYDTFLYRGGMVIQCLATVAVITAAVHPLTWISRILGCRPLRWLGVRSYGIYLWHYPILVLTFTSSTSGGVQAIFHMIIQIAAVFLIASISWKFIEKPIRYKMKGSIWRKSGRSGGITS
ncbi:acyltransferase family protein [Tuberibacillus sp. Marseille-P3662]|uniref:acyltransferase family protein n=1 Tax=Tuberibacillus sp. Marseille-P3662 TaxID=1965358 RepID=UPI001592F58D|nr:acyltransferase [Tuberibacillus sp. Marseille-P3662]